MSEELTKGLVKSRLVEVGYPANQDEMVNGLIYFKENSYKSGVNADKELANAFLNASKKLSGNSGAPDYTAKDKSNDLLIVIECKSDVNKHQTYDNLDDYKNGIGSSIEISDYAVNGALHYASFVNYHYDVVAVAVSGVSKENYRCTSFYLPKNKDFSSLYLLEDGTYNDTLMVPANYREMIDELYLPQGYENFKLTGRWNVFGPLFSLVNYIAKPEYKDDLIRLLLAETAKIKMTL